MLKWKLIYEDPEVRLLEPVIFLTTSVSFLVSLVTCGRDGDG